MERELEKVFISKRLLIVPKVTYCIAAEMVLQLAYIAVTLLCLQDFSTLREVMMAWLVLFCYVVIWAKQAWQFVVTFGTIVRDTKLN